MSICSALIISTMIKIKFKYRLLMVILIISSILFMAVSGAEKLNSADSELMPLKLPANFPAPVYNFKSNPLTKEGFELGRKLFYDPLLSRDNTISCGSCHIQPNAFTHHGHDVSHGIDDQLGTRNSPPIMNLAWSKFFFWDGGVFNLDLQPIGPIENPVEMDEHMPNITAKLQQSGIYKSLFKKAFGTEEITSAKMLKALSQFMLQCVSANSKYDKFVRNEGAKFTADELAGKLIFQQKCSSCHATDLFTDNDFHNNGLIPSMVNDSGRYRITLNEKDWYLFKTPSLRNIAVTAPYMHDGRFRTLSAVLDHYSSAVQKSATLDKRLINGTKTGIPLSADEKVKLIAFLNTLTDMEFLKDSKLSEQ